MDFLSKILAAKRAEVAETKRRFPLDGLVARLERRDAARIALQRRPPSGSRSCGLGPRV